MSLSERFIDDVLTFYAVTTKFDTGVATDADSVATYRVYEEETATPILTGSMALLDAANTAGFYSEQITLSAANGFEIGKCYAIYIAATVNSVAGASHREFVVRKKPLTPVTEGRELVVDGQGLGDATTVKIGPSGSGTAQTAGDVGIKTGFVLSAIGSAALTESYAADGSAVTLNQAVYMIWSLLAERTIAGTTLTAKKLDGSTTSMTFTLDSATIPTTQTRAT